MGHGNAPQIQVIGFLILRPRRRRFRRARRAAQNRQQSMLHLRTQLLLQSDQVVRLRRDRGLPQQTVGRHVDRLQRHRQLISLLDEVSLQQPPHAQFLAHFFRLQIQRHVSSRDR